MSATGISVDLLRELRAICGEQYVAENEQGALNVCPASAEEVAAILQLANQRGFGVTPVGGGTNLWPAHAGAEVLLHTDRLVQVEHYDPADLTVGVGAGMTVAQLNQLVNVDRLMFGCDPPLPGRATIGGILATNAQGPMRHGYGGLRDFCIGIRFVTGDGRKAKGGGRVVKNVAGYDLMKLLIGSYGTLAVITSASFKLFPTPRQTRTFIAEFITWQEALKFRDLIVRSPLQPMCLELVSPRARKLMRPEVTEDAWVICVRGAGSDAVLARYRQELGSPVVKELEGEKESELWRIVQDFPNAIPGWSTAASLYLSASQLGNTLSVLHDRYEAAIIGRVGAGNLIASFPDATLGSPEALANNVASESGASLRFHGRSCGLNPEQIAAIRAVKQALDPNNVLRGRELL